MGNHTPFSSALSAAPQIGMVAGSPGLLQFGQRCLLWLAQAFLDCAESRREEADVVLGPMQSVEAAAEGPALLFVQTGYSLVVVAAVLAGTQVDAMVPVHARQDYLDLDYCAAADLVRRWGLGMEEPCVGTCGYTSALLINRAAEASFPTCLESDETRNNGCLRTTQNSLRTRLPPPCRPPHRPHRRDCAWIRRRWRIQHP